MKRAGLSLCVAVLCASAAVAADLSGVEKLAFEPAKAQGWIITLGSSAQFGPSFLGASKSGFSAMPSLSWRRMGEPAEFSAPDDSFDMALFNGEGFSVGPVASLRSGRYPSRDRRLTGLDKSPTVLEFGGYADYWPIAERLRLRAELRHGLNHSDGFTLALGADWVAKVDRFTFALGPRAQVFDKPLANRLYGVSPRAALSNAFVAPFNAAPGVGTIGVAASASYDWTEAWRTTPYLRYDRLMGDAARSPITARLGSRNQFTFGVGANYSFAMKN